MNESRNLSNLLITGGAITPQWLEHHPDSLKDYVDLVSNLAKTGQGCQIIFLFHRLSGKSVQDSVAILGETTDQGINRLTNLCNAIDNTPERPIRLGSRFGGRTEPTP